MHLGRVQSTLGSRPNPVPYLYLVRGNRYKATFPPTRLHCSLMDTNGADWDIFDEKLVNQRMAV